MTEKPLPVFLHITEFYNQDNCISLKKGDELSVLWKKYAALTGICIFLGILAGGLFKGSYFDDLKTVMNSFIDYVINRYLYIGSTEKTFLLIKIIIKRVGTFALLWLLSLTVAKMPYIVWLCIKNGFITGFFTCFMFMAYGLNAVIYLLAWGFPQLILYILVYALGIMYITENLQKKKSAVIIILFILLIAGCILEAYVNPVCMSTVFRRYS